MFLNSLCFIGICLFSLAHNVLPLAAVGDFEALHCQPSTNVDRSTALHLTTSAPIATNGCVCPAYAGHTPKAFQIVQKYKFSFTNQVFGVCYFSRGCKSLTSGLKTRIVSKLQGGLS